MTTTAENEELPDWAASDLPGFSLVEAMALSSAALHSETDQTNTVLKNQRLTELIAWMKQGSDDKPDQKHLRAKRLLYFRRMLYGAGQRVIEVEVGWEIPQN